jgi:hypothetical protein
LKPIGEQIIELFLLAIPVACISWTVTHEEVFRELREWCGERSKACRKLAERKFFYLFTCEYCFSHYVTAFILIVTGFKLLIGGWRGYLIAGFSLVWIANIYMSLFGRVRLDLKRERIEIENNASSDGQLFPPDHNAGNHHGYEQQTR